MSAHTPSVHSDRDPVADLRSLLLAAPVTSKLAALGLAAQLALETLPPGTERNAGLASVRLVAQLAHGEDIAPIAFVRALYDEDHGNDGALDYETNAKDQLERDVWGVVTCVLGYAGYQAYRHRGEIPDSLVENFDDPAGLTKPCDHLGRITRLDREALAAGISAVRGAAAVAADAWGRPVDTHAAWRAAGREIGDPMARSAGGA